MALKVEKPDQRSILWRVLGFPRVINEKAARTVAAVVALVCVIALATGAHWLLVPLAYGFWARVLAGPRLSPLAQLATKVVAPRLGPPREVAGPPKRFAQGMGAAITTLGVVALALGWGTVTAVLLAALVVAATLEAALGLCIGCRIFGLLIRSGVVPETVCLECADISARLQRV
jgi:transposase InsO family protein